MPEAPGISAWSPAKTRNNHWVASQTQKLVSSASSLDNPRVLLYYVIAEYLGRARLRLPTPVLLPGESHGWRSLVGCSPWGRKELDTTEWLHFSLSCIGEGNGNPLHCYCLENPRDGGAWLGLHRVGHDWSDLAAAADKRLVLDLIWAMDWRVPPLWFPFFFFWYWDIINYGEILRAWLHECFPCVYTFCNYHPDEDIEYFHHHRKSLLASLPGSTHPPAPAGGNHCFGWVVINYW